ncbi:Hos3p [Sugiyamaella lignohabitans]|uniref:Hos3p n=1 Tax=Sugiyamaella lignohabitans TaxID=796027 RepID=A0A167E7E0_9ASCO|nr:Hos3p [Sugiyamaella lignohabitans]ANB13732.1 Hos3p [Sugiyamaella lignohabitans]
MAENTGSQSGHGYDPNGGWDVNSGDNSKPRPSFSEYLNFDDDGDTTEEDMELFSDKYVGRLGNGDLGDDELNAALEAMNLDGSEHGLHTHQNQFARPGAGVYGSQEGSLENSLVLEQSSGNEVNMPVMGSFQPRQEQDTLGSFNDNFGDSQDRERVNLRPVILPPPSSELYNVRDPFSRDAFTPEAASRESTFETSVDSTVDSTLETSVDTSVADVKSDPLPSTKLAESTVRETINTEPQIERRTEEKLKDPGAETGESGSGELPTTPKNKLIDAPIALPDDTDLSEFNSAFAQLKIGQDAISSSTEKKTLILLSPLSYKHVFSRNWVKKSYLDSIVERPERLMAASLGIGTAIAKSPTKYTVQVSDRRSDLRQASHVSIVHGSKWAKRLYQLCNDSVEKLKNGDVEVPGDWHEGDIYLTGETIDALEGVVAVSETAVDKIYAEGESKVFVSIRPPGHHSHPCVPSGFCLINNVHIAIQYARAKYGITHAVILDFDLHHGDGSQDICWKLSGLDDDEEENEEADSENEQHQENQSNSNEHSEPTVKTEQTPSSTTPAESLQTSTPTSSSQDNESPSKSPRKKGKKTSHPPPPPPPPPLSIGYFSLHDINSFPTEFGYATAENIKNASVCVMAHGMCIWNVHLEPYRDEAHFNEIYSNQYSALFEKARQFLQTGKTTSAHNKQPFKPLIVLSAGFDSSEYELLSMQRHQVSVPTSFFNRFTNDSVKLANEFTDGKIISMLEGGYSDAALSTGIFSHLTGLAEEQWDSNWCNPTVAKTLAKGSKLKWKRPATTSTSSTNSHHTTSPTASEPHWLNPGIELGRSLWPSQIKAQVLAATKPSASTTGRRNRKWDDDSTTSVLATPLRVLRDKTRKSVH